MVPRLVPEILSQCAFCDGGAGAAAAAAAAGIGDSRSLILQTLLFHQTASPTPSLQSDGLVNSVCLVSILHHCDCLVLNIGIAVENCVDGILC